MATSICELRWLSYLMEYLKIPLVLPIPLWYDNKRTLHIASNHAFYEHTKHIEFDCHVVRGQYKAIVIFPHTFQE